MRWIWRGFAVLGTFLAVGYGTMHVLIARAVARGTPEYDVRLGGAMGGLFVGGMAAVLLLIALLITGKREPAAEDEADT